MPRIILTNKFTFFSLSDQSVKSHTHTRKNISMSQKDDEDEEAERQFLRATSVRASTASESGVVHLRPDFTLYDLGMPVCLVQPRVTGDPSMAGLLLCHRVVPKPYVFGIGDIGLSEDARRILNEPNAGGCSSWSETLSFVIIETIFAPHASLVHTEMALEYYWPCRITDFSVMLWNHPVGVSVTRAMKWKSRFTREDAARLLEKKLEGIRQSTQHIVRQQSWTRQILHVLIRRKYMLKPLRRSYRHLLEHRPELCGNTIVLLTLCNEHLQWVFDQKRIMATEAKRSRSPMQ